MDGPRRFIYIFYSILLLLPQSSALLCHKVSDDGANVQSVNCSAAHHSIQDICCTNFGFIYCCNETRMFNQEQDSNTLSTSVDKFPNILESKEIEERSLRRYKRRSKSRNKGGGYLVKKTARSVGGGVIAAIVLIIFFIPVSCVLCCCCLCPGCPMKERRKRKAGRVFPVQNPAPIIITQGVYNNQSSSLVIPMGNMQNVQNPANVELNAQNMGDFGHTYALQNATAPPIQMLYENNPRVFVPPPMAGLPQYVPCGQISLSQH